MTKNEVMALLQSHEDERINIKIAVQQQHMKAFTIYNKIFEALRNTHFKSEDERYFAYREAEDFIKQLYRPFNRD